MTKNSELDCRDIFGCTHELEIPISVDGEIAYWRCRCGEYSQQVSNIEPEIHEKMPSSQ
jgi:hypothetical protein